MFHPGESVGGPGAAGEGVLQGISTCSQLSQLTGTPQSRSPVEAKTRLTHGTPRPPLCPFPSWSITLQGLLQPGGPLLAPPSSPGLYQPHQGNSYHNPPAPSQTPSRGRKRSQPPPRSGRSILHRLTKKRRARRVEGTVAGSCQRPAVRAQIPWQPIRSSSRLPAGALDRGPGTGMNERGSSAKKVDVGGMKPGSYCPGKHLLSGASAATAGSPVCRGVPGGRLPREPTQAMLGIKPSGGQQKGGFCVGSSPPAFLWKLFTSQQRFWHPWDGRPGAVPAAGEDMGSLVQRSTDMHQEGKSFF